MNNQQDLNNIKSELVEAQRLMDNFSNTFGRNIGNNFKTILKNIDKLNESLSKGRDITKENQKVLEKIALEDSVLDIRKQAAIKRLATAQSKLARANSSHLKNQAKSTIRQIRLELNQIVNQQQISNQLHNAARLQSDLAEKQKESVRLAEEQLKKYESIGESLAKTVRSITTLTILKFILDSALQANRELVKLGKTLGTNSYIYRENLANSARSSRNIFSTTKNLNEAYHEITQSTGFAYEYTVDQLLTQIKLTKQVGLQAEYAAQIQRLAILNNKSTEKIYKSFIKGLVASRNQYKVGINFKDTLEEATKVSGQLTANLGYNPERISAAVVRAKSLGFTLSEARDIASSLLDFEGSIYSELKAELLLGKSLNLERARALSLQGDYVGVLEEINKQGITADKFAKMNVIQQRSLADVFGMQVDQLSEQLRKQQEAIASGKSLKQITEEEAQASLERQNIQERFNQSILKLKDYFANLVSGPIGLMLDGLSKAASYVGTLINAFDKISGGYGSKLIALLIGVPTLISTLRMGMGILRGFAKFTVPLPVVMAGGSNGIPGGGKGGGSFGKFKDIFSGGRAGRVARGRAMQQMGKFAKIGGVGALIGGGLNLTSELSEGKGVRDALLGTLDSSKFTALGAIIGSIIPGVGTLVGAGIGGVADLIVGKSFTDDMISKYGKRTLLTPDGNYALNNNDTVIAGTNLFKGDDVLSLGKGEISLPSPSVNFDALLQTIKELKSSVDDLKNRNIILNMDGVKVGTGTYAATYKSI